jgi:uncharacterized LabA/DUF88 family protein
MDIEKKIAVLIDADNVSYKYIKPILNELSKYGIPTYKRIYGDWTKPEMNTWKSLLLTYSIAPVQQYSYTSGKNATDSALIIDAMDILYSGHVDSFCIVSSDSDFTRLAARLREAGRQVIGMGEKKTPQPFISACETFKYLEVLVSGEVLAAAEKGTGAAENKSPALAETESAAQSNIASRDEIIRVIQKIVEDTSEEDGWAFLGMVGGVLNKQQPDFDSRNYGYQKLTQFVKSLGAFDIEHRTANNSSVRHTYIRNKAGENVAAKPAPKPIGKFVLKQDKSKKTAASKG